MGKKIIQLGNAKDATATRAIYTGTVSVPKLQLTFKLESGEEYEIELDYLLARQFIDQIYVAEDVIFPRRRGR